MTNLYAPPRTAVEDVVDAPAHVVPAERGSRLGAAILDGIIFGAMVYVPMLIAMAGETATGSGNGDGEVMLLLGAGLTLVGFGVWCWLTLLYMSRNGQSIAKKLVGIKVVRTDGTPVSLARLIWLRNVLNWVISLVPFYGLVDTLFIFGESRQCLHDKIADTVVVDA